MPWPNWSCRQKKMMLKLIIADDERVIRETISSMLPWEELGIRLIGLCKDGIEAYNMILDESPDIVMTDIRMPGLSGLELARKITQTDRQIQFIFLSGYEEFEYAREAMEYGIRHYLLKPCSEEKLIESIRQASADCLRAKKLVEEKNLHSEMLHVIHQDAMYHLILDGMALGEMEHSALLEELNSRIETYGKYQDFGKGPCYLYYVYFLEWEYLEGFLKKLEKYEQETGDYFIFYGVYVKNTLLLFGYEGNRQELIRRLCGENAFFVETAEEKYENLPELLEKVLLKVKRYDMMYAIHNFTAIPILNNQNTMKYMQKIYGKLERGEERSQCIEEILSMVRETSRLESLQMLGNSICTQMNTLGAYSVQEMTSFFRKAGKEREIERLREMIVEMILEAAQELKRRSRNYGGITEQIMDYVENHLSDAELTLKKIAEEHLYMNVDYVSRQFRKTTGKKFSQYLTEERVKRAKELLLGQDSSKIQYVAEQVGCGNNPQYFSQIFKKAEGVTPGKWASEMRDNI